MEAAVDTGDGESTENTEQPSVGRIAVGDIEELQYSVDPWDLRMDQLSGGRLRAAFSVVQLRGILLTREFWSHRVVAAGLTPAGYVAVAGACAGDGFNWCGSQIGSGRLVFAVDATDIDFVTADEDDHWVVLIPVTLLADRIGEELFADLLRIDRTLVGDPRAIARLSALVVHIIGFLGALGDCLVDPEVLVRLEDQLLAAVVHCVLRGQIGYIDPAQATRRFLAYQQARRRIEADCGRISVDELAEQCGVSRRSLEKGFKEALAMSPQSFARHTRLNGWHRELLLALPQAHTVTAAAENWVFSELGRAAGYYHRLFGELPRDTLHRDGATHGARLVDALH